MSKITCRRLGFSPIGEIGDRGHLRRTRPGIPSLRREAGVIPSRRGAIPGTAAAALPTRAAAGPSDATVLGRDATIFSRDAAILGSDATVASSATAIGSSGSVIFGNGVTILDPPTAIRSNLTTFALQSGVGRFRRVKNNQKPKET